MARCTAPTRGHRSAAAAADCPACGGRSRGYGGYGGYGYGSYGSYSPSPSPSSSGGTGRRSSKPKWSPSGSGVWYTPEEVLALTPVREEVENLAASQPDLRDVFLCHACDDRQGSAKDLHDLLEARGVRVWFSEKDLGLGVPMMRAIDKGLVNSRVGIVLVTPGCFAASRQRGSPTRSFLLCYGASGWFRSCTGQPTRNLRRLAFCWRLGLG